MTHPNHTDVLIVPNEHEMAEFFRGQPVESVPEDGYWCYVVQDESGVKLRFSFNIIERSVQTEFSLGKHVLGVVVQEGAVRLDLASKPDERAIYGDFLFEGARTYLKIELEPQLSIQWSTLLLNRVGTAGGSNS